MTEWWNALPLALQIFYGIGILSSLIVVVQLVLSLSGIDAEGVDAIDVDVGGFDSGSGIGLFSTQTIAAFFLGFGWVGAAAIKSGLSILIASLLALAFGAGAMFVMFYLLRGLLRLQSKGNLKYESAIGKEGTVYVTIPGSDEEGGQVQVTFQGRLTTASARKSSPGSLKPGQRVRITGVYDVSSFLVEPFEPESSNYSNL